MSIEFPTIIDDMMERGINPFQLYQARFGRNVQLPSMYFKFNLIDSDTLKLRLLEAVQAETPIEDWTQLANELVYLRSLRQISES